MIQKVRYKKILACFISIVICFAAISSYATYHTSAVPYTHGIMFGQYYRLRHVDSNLYLTMNSTSDADNVGCSLQLRSPNNNAQIFYLGISNSTNTYTLSPLSSASKRVLSLSNSSSSNNIPIVLKSSSSNDTQLWSISQTTFGHSIKSYCNNKYMATRSLNTAAGTAITTYSYSAASTDWRFEPAYEGTSAYFVTTTLSTKNSNTVNRIINNISSSGYDCERINLPVSSHIRVATPSNRLTVLHGHGGAGYIVLDQSNGTKDYMYSDDFKFLTYRNSYMMFISCNSAASTSSRDSLIDIAYNQGACCVTGYNNSVAGGENYLEVMMNYMQKFPTMTLYEAMLNADKTYTAEQRKQEACPANTTNRCTYGNSNFSIYMN